MRNRRDLLKNPFVQASAIFTAFGMLMIRCPEEAVYLAYWPLLLISVVLPLAISFRDDWLSNFFQVNMAVISGWLAVIVLIRWLMPPDFLWRGGEFWRLALFYPYAVVLSAILRLLRTPIKRAVQTYTTRRI
jgi:hypothetical protein